MKRFKRINFRDVVLLLCKQILVLEKYILADFSAQLDHYIANVVPKNIVDVNYLITFI